MSDTLVVRVGTANVKGGRSVTGVPARRAALGHSVDRMVTAARRAYDVNGASILGTQETAGVQIQDGNKALRYWKVHAGTPNVTYRSGATLGNAVWWRHDLWDRVTVDELAVHVGHVTSRYVIPEDLYFPVVVLRHVETGLALRVGDFHFPAGRTPSAQAAKQRCATAVEGAYRDDPIPTVWVGDRNRADLLSEWDHVEHGVDYVGSPTLRVRARVVDTASVGVVSDHAGVSGEVVLPLPVEPPALGLHPCPEPGCGFMHLPPVVA